MIVDMFHIGSTEQYELLTRDGLDELYELKDNDREFANKAWFYSSGPFKPDDDMRVTIPWMTAPLYMAQYGIISDLRFAHQVKSEVIFRYTWATQIIWHLWNDKASKGMIHNKHSAVGLAYAIHKETLTAYAKQRSTFDLSHFDQEFMHFMNTMKLVLDRGDISFKAVNLTDKDPEK